MRTPPEYSTLNWTDLYRVKVLPNSICEVSSNLIKLALIQPDHFLIRDCLLRMQDGLFKVFEAPTFLYQTPISASINDCLATVQSLRVLAGIENSFWKGTSSWIYGDWMGINIT